MVLFLDIYTFSLICLLILVPVLICLDYCNFKISLEVRLCKTILFFVLKKILLAILDLYISI